MTNTRRIMILGDSHAKGFLPHTRVDSDAIAERAGTPEELRMAVSGSTAEEWALNSGGRMERAVLAAASCDAALISLGGNDLFKIARDGNIEDAEIARTTCFLYDVISMIALAVPRTFVLLYGYPFSKPDAQKMMAVARLDAFISAISGAAGEIRRARVETLDERLVLLPQDWPGDDIHPFRSGYERIGDELLRRLSS
ncbi:MAG TPA: SGNH/GDSL hydrolase family protein [Kiritimatiellia bacterium]|nr:SGNH/GDSL hydrolase family protein [Kiritimatiellia bacterium]